MSGFDTSLRAARERHRRTLQWLAAAAAVLVVAVAGFFLVGGFSVQVLPPEAEPLAELRIVRGPALVAGGRVYTLPGAVVLQVEAEGFYPEKVALPRDRQIRFVEVTLRERPGRLLAETRPPAPDAEWSVDGRPVAVGARLDLELAHGNYTVGVDSPRYRTEQVPVEMVRGQENGLVVDLELVRGQLEVTTQPPGAAISVNGLALGTAPGTWEVEVGTHEIEVTLPGHQSVSETVRTTKTSPGIQRDYALLPEDGYVTFRLKPGGGSLLLDGRIQSNLDDIPVRALVAHRATYRKDGHADAEREFRLQPGERTVVELSLRAVVGEVEVASTPAADVSVDGKPAGTTPLRLKLSAVEHEIVVARKGYETVTRKLTPVPDRVSRIDLRLLTEREARLRDASETVVNSVGMSLRLFLDPGEFVMGSPRGERGRRQNEFLRPVRLTRTIYAGVHEVTRKQLGEFRGAAPGSGDLPATGVGWTEAVRFCNWLSKREGLEAFYRLEGERYLGVNGDADGYRLPTEAEWEWLARKSGRWEPNRFPWGNDEKVPARAGNLADESAKGKVGRYIPNYTDGFSGLAPVGQFKPNRGGIHDLAGNVREWTHDAHSPFPPAGGGSGGSEVNPRRDEPAGAHVVRGSGWRSATLSELRASYRDSSAGPGDDLGFRVVRYLYGDEHAADR